MANGKSPLLAAIDFGACNIKAALWDGKSFTAPKLNTNQHAGRSCPNFLWYKVLESGDLEHVLGNAAKKHAALDQDNVAYDIKRKLAREEWREFIPALNHDVSAIEAASDIFAQLRRKLPKNGDEPVEAVLTAPVSFSHIQIGRLREAAENAGFNVKSIVSESFAALFSLRDLEDLEDGLHVVFDFGGSTLDVSIFRVAHKAGLEIFELGASGLRLGGLDIDEAILDLFVRRGDYDPLAASYKTLKPETVKQILLLDMGGKKEELYSGFEDEINLIIDPDINLTKMDIEEILDGPAFKGKITALLDSLFEELENGPVSHSVEDVVKVWPFGGSVRIGWVQKLLEEYFSPDVFRAEDFDPDDSDAYVDIKGMDDSFNYMSVATGAARHLILRESGAVSVRSVLPFKVGFMLDGKFVPCLEKNSPGGFESPHRLLPLSSLAANDWKVPIYQKFSTGDYDEPIHMGCITLDPALYPGEEFPILTMKTSQEGHLEIFVYQRQLCGEESEYDINLVQEFILNKGSAYESK